MKANILPTVKFEFHRNIGFLGKGKESPASSCRRPRTCLSDWKTKAKHGIHIAGGILLEELFERAVLPEMMSSTHIHCSGSEVVGRRDGCRAGEGSGFVFGYASIL
ncbi:hypothetical protein CEXT_656471 [Caerostris extrusa]|uniref:Uncharacterized protein n=1 Tax=Caerostris extrusa TaxID=172846 RepID=A0AAV4UGH0_CAEEX|nr:hypothetical protein CEXT_656471 [Caerostris extrusa]